MNIISLNKHQDTNTYKRLIKDAVSSYYAENDTGEIQCEMMDPTDLQEIAAAKLAQLEIEDAFNYLYESTPINYEMDLIENVIKSYNSSRDLILQNQIDLKIGQIIKKIILLNMTYGINNALEKESLNYRIDNNFYEKYRNPDEYSFN